MADELVSSKDIDSLKKEISEYDILKKIPLVVTYAAETLVKSKMPTCAHFLTKGLYGVALVGTSVFSVSVLPMLYVYRCSKKSEGISLLCADTLYKLDKPLDYVGQVSAKKHLFSIFLVGYTLSLVVGFLLSDLLYTLVLGVATFVTAFVAVIPSWPHYRKNPLKFRSPK